MGRAKGIIKRLDVALKKVGPPARLVYKRVITRTGGDDLIGRPGSVTKVDTLLTPQPMYQRLSRSVVGQHVPAEMVSDTIGRDVAANYMFVFSPTAVPIEDLRNENLQIVLKDKAGNEEVFRFTDDEPVPFQGTDVMYIAYLRSTKQP